MLTDLATLKLSDITLKTGSKVNIDPTTGLKSYTPVSPSNPPEDVDLTFVNIRTGRSVLEFRIHGKVTKTPERDVNDRLVVGGLAALTCIT